MTGSVAEEIREPFRPRARLLQLLGDELIGSARLAVFELVKNAYDADANEVSVCLDLEEGSEPSITVTDDGEGMTLDTLRSIWLVPGDDHRWKQRNAEQKTPKHGRLPLGEKGLGRFAVHKLGNVISLVTRSEGSQECVVEIDWNQLIGFSYLDEAPVTINVRVPEVFTNGTTGTRIEIHHLKTEWSRGEVRKLHNQITSICSPFQDPSGFNTELKILGKQNWLNNLLDIQSILDYSIWRYSFSINKLNFNSIYEFKKVPGLKLEGRKVVNSDDQLLLPPQVGSESDNDDIVANSSIFEGIGSISGEFYVYDRDRGIRNLLTNIKMLEGYLVPIRKVGDFPVSVDFSLFQSIRCQDFELRNSLTMLLSALFTAQFAGYHHS